MINFESARYQMRKAPGGGKELTPHCIVIVGGGNPLWIELTWRIRPIKPLISLVCNWALVIFAEFRSCGGEEPHAVPPHVIIFIWELH